MKAPSHGVPREPMRMARHWVEPEASSFDWRRYLLVVGPILVVLAGVLLYVFFAEDPEVKAVKTLIKTARQYVIDKDIDACVALLDRSYKDNFGNDYDRVVREARRNLDDVSNIAIKLRHMEIEVDRGTATARFEMRFTAMVDDHMGRRFPVTGVVSERPTLGANWEAVTVDFIRHNENWRVTGVTIAPLKRPLL